MKTVSEVSVEKEVGFDANEFQLAELEQRLEMAGMTTSFTYCCECFMNSCGQSA
jgi:hypothetical protein